MSQMPASWIVYGILKMKYLENEHYFIVESQENA